MTKYFYQYYQVFSIFTYKKCLMIKSYQFFQILQRFYKEREKTLIEQSMKIEELRKIGLCFITGCFIKPFKMIIIFSSISLFVYKIFIGFASSLAAQFLLFNMKMRQEISNREIEKLMSLWLAYYNIYFKTNFNLLVMNVTQINFLYW